VPAPCNNQGMTDAEVRFQVDVAVNELRAAGLEDEQLSCKTILTKLSMNLTEQERAIAERRAKEWEDPPALYHLPLPDNNHRARCGKETPLRRTAEAKHLMLTKGVGDLLGTAEYRLCQRCQAHLLRHGSSSGQ
jgi:hypothetical protein